MLKNVIAIGVFSVVAGQAGADLINVDFNANANNRPTTGTPAMSGAAAIGTAGDVWNGVLFSGTGGTASALLDSTGAVTTAAVTVDGANLNGNWENDSLTTLTGANNLLADYININDAEADGTTVDVTLSGLAENAAFTLVLYGVGDAANQNADFAVDEAVEGTQATVGGSNTALASPQHYVTFTGFTSATGEINIDFIKQGTWTSFNGFQVDVVPEPSSLALLGLGGLCVLRRRRK